MKQKINGKKVQNWHRPLGASQTHRRYLKHRDDDPEVSNNDRERVEIVDCDDYWDPYDPYCNEADHQDINAIMLDSILTKILYPNAPTINIKLNIHDQSYDGPFISKAPTYLPSQYTPSLEQILAWHVETATYCWHDPEPLRLILIEAIGNPQNLKAIRAAGENINNPEFAKRLVLFSPFWVRKPSLFQGKRVESLLDHLFVSYKTPSFLYKEWWRLPDFRYKWIGLFILLAQGGSVKRALDKFEWGSTEAFDSSQWSMSSGLLKYLHEAPTEASPLEACLYAEARSVGGTDVEFRRILQNEGYIFDPTNSWNQSFRPFWQETVRWLTAHRGEISDDECNLILSWAHHERIESTRGDYQGTPEGRPFSWKGRSVPASLERSRCYQRQIMEREERNLRIQRAAHIDRNRLQNLGQTIADVSELKWSKHDWDWSPPGSKWSFIELTTSQELMEEGKAQNHCVWSYDQRCAMGASAIVSLRSGKTHCLTIELNPYGKQLIQARGKYNRSATDAEQEVIGLWMKTIVRSEQPLAG